MATDAQSRQAAIDLLIMEWIEDGLTDYEIIQMFNVAASSLFHISEIRRKFSGDYTDEELQGY